MAIKKESYAGDVWADISKDLTPYIIANPNGQIKLLHEDTPGFIALFRKTKDGTSQYHYKRDEIDNHLHEWMQPDSYVSMNTFYTPKRLITNLKEIRTAFVDIDCHNLGWSAEMMAIKLKRQFFGKSLPVPNMIIYSGRGLNLIWFMDPLSGLAVERWDKLQKAIYDTVKSLGADNKATDASRVFRLAGTTNSKNGAQVHCEVLHEERITFDRFVGDYFPDLLKRVKKPQKASKTKPDSKGKVKHLFNEFTLMKARMNDIETLNTLRNGEMEGSREYALFLYRYWALVMREDKDYASNAMLEMNGRFSEPLARREALGDTKSAERYYDSGIPFKITHKRIIEWLNITNEEQQQLVTIISPSEKRRRDRESQQERRRAQGVIARSEYEAERQSKKAERLDQLRKLKAELPAATQKDLAEALGVALPTVKKYLAELKQ